MRKILFIICFLIVSVASYAQQTTIVGKRVMAIDSFYLNGVWIKKADVDNWNNGSAGVKYVDTLFIRNDSLVYVKDGEEYHIKVFSGAYDDLTGKPTIPTQFNPIGGTNISLSGTYPNITFDGVENNNQLTNGKGYITHSDAASQISDSLSNYSPGGSINLGNSDLVQTDAIRYYDLNQHILSFVDKSLTVQPLIGNLYTSSGLSGFYSSTLSAAHISELRVGSFGGGDTLNSSIRMVATNYGLTSGNFISRLIIDTAGLTFFNNANEASHLFNIDGGGNLYIYQQAAPSGDTLAAGLDDQGKLVTFPRGSGGTGSGISKVIGTNGISNVNDSTVEANTDVLLTHAQFADSLNAHAVTVLAPLYQTDTAIGLDTSRISSNAATQFYVDSSIVAAGSGGSGSVTSVGLSAPTGFSVSGSPVTGAGTLGLSFASGYSLPTIAKQSQWDAKVAPIDTVDKWAPKANYLTAESDNLQSVTTRGSTTNNSILITKSNTTTTIGDTYGSTINVAGATGGWARGYYVQGNNYDSTKKIGASFGVMGAATNITYAYLGIDSSDLTGIWSSSKVLRLYPNGSLYYGTPPANSSSTYALTLGSDGHTIGTRTLSQLLSDIGGVTSTQVRGIVHDSLVDKLITDYPVDSVDIGGGGGSGTIPTLDQVLTAGNTSTAGFTAGTINTNGISIYDGQYGKISGYYSGYHPIQIISAGVISGEGSTDYNAIMATGAGWKFTTDGDTETQIFNITKDGGISSAALKNNATGDSILTTDASGNFKLRALKALNADSIQHIPVSSSIKTAWTGQKAYLYVDASGNHIYADTLPGIQREYKVTSGTVTSSSSVTDNLTDAGIQIMADYVDVGNMSISFNRYGTTSYVVSYVGDYTADGVVSGKDTLAMTTLTTFDTIPRSEISNRQYRLLILDMSNQMKFIYKVEVFVDSDNKVFIYHQRINQ